MRWSVRKLNKFLKSTWLYVMVLGAVLLWVSIANFPAGMWLTGWDNLHPEFNFGLNFRRGLFAVWQEFQGLGTFGGHGYGATLLHTLIIWILSWVFPALSLRAIFTFMTLWVGSFGVFVLVRWLFKAKSEWLKSGTALIGAGYYGLNLATVQAFYIQLEAFIVHFAVLPWLMLTLFRYLKRPSARRLAVFGLVSLVGSIQGFIPPLFIVTALFILVPVVLHWARSRTRERLMQAIAIGATLLVTNAYWLLPVGYFTTSKRQVYLEAYNNLRSTGTFELQSKKYGGLNDVALLKGFIFEALDNTEEGVTFQIMAPWSSHMENKSVKIIGYALFSLVLVGVVISLRREVSTRQKAIAVLFLISFGALAQDIFPFSIFAKFVQDYVPILRQAFRLSFTKFSISLAFVYSTLISYGLVFLIEWIRSREINRGVGRFILGFIFIGAFGSIVYFSRPAFEGNFIYRRISQDIPKAYLDLFDFFKGKNGGERIANLPQGWSWGWSIYDWGYTGSGFLWYGIEQPILDRSFDVWGRENESYYWEISRALFAEDYESVERVLEKYGVTWVVFDPNVVSYPDVRNVLYADRLDVFLSGSTNFVLEEEFESEDLRKGGVKVYRFLSGRKENEFVSLISKLPAVEGQSFWKDEDLAYKALGDYKLSKGEGEGLAFPFGSLFTKRSQEEVGFDVLEIGNEFVLRVDIEVSEIDRVLQIPELGDFDKNTKFELRILEVSGREIFKKEYGEEEPGEETVYIPAGFSGRMEVGVRLDKDSLVYSSDEDENFLEHEPVDCDIFPEGKYEQRRVEEEGFEFLRLESVDSANCYAIELDNLSQGSGYLLWVEGRNISGRPLELSVINRQSRRAGIETSLRSGEDFQNSFFVIPSMNRFGRGYSIRFNNSSIGEEETVNDISELRLVKIPYSLMTNLLLEGVNRVDRLGLNGRSIGFEVSHPNESWYKVVVSGRLSGDETLVLSQAYDDDWVAFQKLGFFRYKRLEDHVMVNNWSNGWVVPQDAKEVVILFWPQLLEFVGLGLLIGASLWLVRSVRKENITGLTE